jgi:hypothetical protein
MTFEEMAAATRANFRAYETEDRPAIEALIGNPFSFTSPFDDHIDRATYFERCWPNAGTMTGYDVQYLAPAGADGVLVVYEARAKAGRMIRNAELHRFANGKLAAVEVFFGLGPGEPVTSPDRW